MIIKEPPCHQQGRVQEGAFSETVFLVGQGRHRLIRRAANVLLMSSCRTYYGRGGRSSMLPQNYSTDNLGSGLGNAPYTTTEHSQSESSVGISRPSTRPQHYGHSRNDSMPITRIRPSDINLVEVRGAPRGKVSAMWSPHLWHGSSNLSKRRSLFIAPSIDRENVGKGPNRRNMQVVLFTIGFIFPLGM